MGVKISRRKQSMKNAIAAAILNIATILMGLVVRKIFVSYLSAEYLGLGGVFDSILAILTLADMGFGGAVMFHLYRSLVSKSHSESRALVSFLSKANRIVAGIVAVGGLLLMPFLHLFIGEINIDVNIHIVMLLVIGNSVASYLLNYRRIVFQADQKSYVSSMIHLAAVAALNCTRILILVLTQNYYLYLLASIATTVVENIVIHVFASVKYHEIFKSQKNKKLPTSTRKDLKRRIYATVWHKIAGYVVSGTDNILISLFFGLYLVGIYANYYLIINALVLLFSQIFAATTASFGNLLVVDKSKANESAHRILFLNSFVMIVVSTVLLVVIQPFIALWLGEEFILQFHIVVVLIINFYLQSVRSGISAVQDGAGIVYENRFVPIAESVINLGLSVLFARFFGMAGIFIGTCISNLFLHIYSYPKYVYKLVLGLKKRDYICSFMTYFLIALVVGGGTYIASNFLVGGASGMLRLVLLSVLSLGISTGVLCVVFFRNDSFRYFVSLLQNGAKAICKKVRRKV